MVLSASSITALHQSGSIWGYFDKQLISAVLGAAVLIAAYRLPLAWWRRRVRMALLVAFALLFCGLGAGYRNRRQ
jgi:cell division protein FtsW (lipid II flippase)